MSNIRQFIRKYTAIAITLAMPLNTGAVCSDVSAAPKELADDEGRPREDEELANIINALNGSGNPEDLYGISVNVSEIAGQLPAEQREALLASGINLDKDIEFTSDDKGGYSSDGTPLNAFLNELMEEGVTSLEAEAMSGDTVDGITPVSADSRGVTPATADSDEKSVTPVTADSESKEPGMLSSLLDDFSDMEPVDREDDPDEEPEDEDDEGSGDDPALSSSPDLVSPFSRSIPGLFTVADAQTGPDEDSAAAALSGNRGFGLFGSHPVDLYDEDEDEDDYEDEDYDDEEYGDEDYDYEDGESDDASAKDTTDGETADPSDEWTGTGYGVYSASKVIEAPAALPPTMERALGSDTLASDNDFLRVFIPSLGESNDIDSGTVVTVRMQTARDFVERDEFGIPRDSDGQIVGRDFVRYVGVDKDGVLEFTAGEDGIITYPSDKKLYFNSEDNCFYSDEECTIPLTGIKGFVDLAQLMMDSSSVLSLLDAVDGTAATIEIPGSQVYPKTYIEKSTGRELSKDEAKALPEDSVETRDPEGVSWLVWKVTRDDSEYAPDFAEYACGNKDGDILFYTDANGRIYYDVSSRALYDGKYLFSFDGDSASDSDNDRLITSYAKLELPVYPGPGETTYFTVDGEAFAMSVYDTGEGAKGRYLCRNVTELISQETGSIAGANDSGKNYSKLLEDPTVFMLMDSNGNICYASDSFEWQFLDYGLDYDRLRSLMEAGQLPAADSEEEPQEEAPEVTEEQPDAGEATTPEPEEPPEEPEEIDDDVEIDGHTRDEFDSDEEWEDFVNGEFYPDDDYFGGDDDDDDEDEEDDENYDRQLFEEQIETPPAQGDIVTP